MGKHWRNGNRLNLQVQGRLQWSRACRCELPTYCAVPRHLWFRLGLSIFTIHLGMMALRWWFILAPGNPVPCGPYAVRNTVHLPVFCQKLTRFDAAADTDKLLMPYHCLRRLVTVAVKVTVPDDWRIFLTGIWWYASWKIPIWPFLKLVFVIAAQLAPRCFIPHLQ